MPESYLEGRGRVLPVRGTYKIPSQNDAPYNYIERRKAPGDTFVFEEEKTRFIDQVVKEELKNTFPKMIRETAKNIAIGGGMLMIVGGIAMYFFPVTAAAATPVLLKGLELFAWGGVEIAAASTIYTYYKLKNTNDKQEVQTLSREFAQHSTEVLSKSVYAALPPIANRLSLRRTPQIPTPNRSLTTPDAPSILSELSWIKPPGYPPGVINVSSLNDLALLREERDTVTGIMPLKALSPELNDTLRNRKIVPTRALPIEGGLIFNGNVAEGSFSNNFSAEDEKLLLQITGLLNGAIKNWLGVNPNDIDYSIRGSNSNETTFPGSERHTDPNAFIFSFTIDGPSTIGGPPAMNIVPLQGYSADREFSVLPGIISFMRGSFSGKGNSGELRVDIPGAMHRAPMMFNEQYPSRLVLLGAINIKKIPPHLLKKLGISGF
jgi:hypothetical protein